jgi:hypothetical protein
MRGRANPTQQEVAGLMRELEELESRIARIWMPRGISDTSYTLKLHVRYVRDLLMSVARPGERSRQPASS